MMQDDYIEKPEDNLLMRLSDLDEDFSIGIINHFHAYVHRVSPGVLKIENGKVSYKQGVINEKYINNYLNKTSVDFSAKDCAYLAINHVGIPPEEEMSVDSIEKLIRGIIRNDYSDKAYGKHVKGKKNVVCVDMKTAYEITSSQDVIEYIKKQINKAEKREEHKNEVEWRAYELQKQKIEYLDSLSSSVDDYDCYIPFTLSGDQKTYLMLEAIFKMIYTDFDFAKYEEYREEMWLLEADWDFGKRYQELEAIFNAPDYKGEFYKVKSDNVFLDALADKIAEKIIEKTAKNGSSK